MDWGAWWAAVYGVAQSQTRLKRLSSSSSSGSVGKESDHNVVDPCLIPGSGRSPGEGNGNLLWHFCLENSMDRGARQATVHGSRESDTTVWLNKSLIYFWYWLLIFFSLIFYIILNTVVSFLLIFSKNQILGFSFFSIDFLFWILFTLDLIWSPFHNFLWWKIRLFKIFFIPIYASTAWVSL